ncbi:glycosyltransferase [Cellulomonas sp. ATA003]|uniref:glycosyltransferase n=1 Tax=Cellulomonas sp. ATA003 TaxID=3073064 RepID=UPI0028733B6E|nr:glycosyltransferase [Cellulomonas sp. ATA003]WNB87089.1 glycosyltransferase [Cellulomonas sp. ATA003]
MLVEHRLAEDGASRSNLRLAHRWSAAGVAVRVLALQRPGADAGAPVPPGVEPVHPWGAREPRLRWALLGGLMRLVVLARRTDVVLVGREIGWGLLVGRVAALIARRPCVVMVRSEPRAALEQYVARRLQGPMRWALRTADRVVCITPGLVEPTVAMGVSPERVTVVRNGVDVAAIRAAAAASPSVEVPGTGPVVVGVGRLCRQKGFDVLVRAHARVVTSGLPHRLVLLGEGPDRAELTRLAAELGVADSVTMPGFVADPVATVARADLYCLPSRWEGFGQTLAEALVVGTPAVAADCVSGPRLLLGDGSRGALVPVDDVAALADAIGRHLRRPEVLRGIAARAQPWAAAHLDVGRTADGVLGVLADVVVSR